MASLGELLHGGPVDASEVQRVREIVLFEEPGLKQRLVRFWTLLLFASAIATYGLMSDSVATVIGAMIVAPLMLPIMGLAFGISIGDRRAILNSLVIALSGIAIAIGVGFVLALPWGTSLNVEGTTQIMIRTSPRLLDLLAALATGLAGAFAMGRKDVSDTLPGVAIAISLVPPLANVGILLATDHADLAMGSLTLFLTNYLAIVLTGSFMFGLMRFPNAALADLSRNARRTAVAIVVVLTALIIVPLATTGYSINRAYLAESRAADAATTWLAGSDYRLVSSKATEDVVVVVAGEGDLPPMGELEASLKGQLFGLPMTVEVVPQTRSTFATE